MVRGRNLGWNESYEGSAALEGLSHLSHFFPSTDAYCKFATLPLVNHIR